MINHGLCELVRGLWVQCCQVKRTIFSGALTTLMYIYIYTVFNLIIAHALITVYLFSFIIAHMMIFFLTFYFIYYEVMSYEEGCLMSMKFLQIKVYIFLQKRRREVVFREIFEIIRELGGSNSFIQWFRRVGNTVGMTVDDAAYKLITYTSCDDHASELIHDEDI